MIKQLGKAIGIVIKAECAESFMHADVDAWGAPGECHKLVAKGSEKRLRRARKHAEAVARAPWRVIVREAKRRGSYDFGRRHEVAFSRIYMQQNYPF